MSNSSVTNRLLIHLMTRNVKSFQQGMETLRNVTENARKAKDELQGFRDAMRAASDADSNWTDADIDLMIITKLNETLQKQGQRPI